MKWEGRGLYYVTVVLWDGMQRNNKKMFPIKAFLVTTSLCCLIEYGYGKSLDVAAFNIQVFGQAKVSNKDVVTNLVRVS